MALGPLASRYINVSDLPWKPTGHPGVEMKVLLEDKESGLLTALFRWQPGAVLRCTSTSRSSRPMCSKAASSMTRAR